MSLSYRTVAAGDTWAVLGKFGTGKTVTVAMFNAETGASIPLDSSATTEIGSTGVYRANSSQITTDPTSLTTILWQMTDTDTGVLDQGVVKIGGHPDHVDADISSRAAPGAAMDLVTDALDADAVATSGANEMRDAILSDSTPFAGADVAEILADTAALDGRVPSDPADQSLLVAEHDSTQAAIAALENLSAADAADAVWDEPRSGHSTPGTYGENTGDAAMRGTDGANTTVPLAAATDQAEHDSTQAAIAALNDPSEASIAAEVDSVLSAAHGGGVWENASDLTAQQVRDAMKLAPSAGAPAADSVDEKLDSAVSDLLSATLGSGDTVDAALTKLQIVERILRNKMVTNPATGRLEIYNDAGSAVLYSVDLYEDAAATQPYQGAGAERRERIE